MSLLNLTPSEVIAAAAIASALATLFVAFFSFGTWRLYQLESKRHLSDAGRDAARLLREEREIRRVAGGGFGPVSPASERVWEVTDRISKRRSKWLEARRATLDGLRESLRLGPRAIASIDAAHEELVDIQPYWDELREGVEKRDTFLYELDRRLVQAELMEIATTLRTAYQAVPSRVRMWGGKQPEYEALFSQAKAALKERAKVAKESATEDVVELGDPDNGSSEN